MSSTETKKRFACVVCGEELSAIFTDFTGEGVCSRCEAPYDLPGFHGRPRTDEPVCNLNDKGLELVTRYWKETGRRCGLGTYFGAPDDVTVTQRRIAFYTWVEIQEGPPPPAGGGI